MEIRAFERLAEKQQDAGDSGSRNAQQRGKPKGKAAKGEAGDAPKRYDYRLEYTARASAFVKVLNGLAKSPRFYVVGDFGFEHEGDSLKSRLDRSASASGGSSRRRGGRGREREKKEQEAESGFVTNPETDPPILVRMRLSVYDFGRGGASAAPAKEGK